MEKAEAELASIPDRKPSWGSPLPDDANCPKCQGFMLDHPSVKERRAIAKEHAPPNFYGEVRATLAKFRCKCEERARDFEAARLEAANLPHSYDPEEYRTFRNFEGTTENLDLYAAAEAFAYGNMEEHILLLVGAFGCGKSHILEAVGRYWLSQRRTVRYEMVGDMLEAFRHTFADPQARDIFTWLNWYKAQDLLLLDDLGMEKATDWTIEKIVQIIDDRLRDGRLTVITTNNTKKDMEAVVGPRLTSRLYPTNRDLGEVRFITTGAPSWRDRKGAKA